MQKASFKFKKLKEPLVIIAGALIGLTAFFLVTGYESLDPRNMSWVNGGLDPASHYFGWDFYRRSSWGFPIGVNPNYGMEFGNPIVFADALPLMAIFFKIFQRHLPDSFQYFGIYTAISFVLTAYFSVKCISLFSQNIKIQLLGGCIVLFYPPMLAMVGTFSALSSHYLILAALYLALKNKNKNLGVSYCWIFLVCASCLIHFYLFVMVLCIYLSTFIDRLLVRGKLAFGGLSAELFFLSVALAIVMWQGGYFSIELGSGSASGYGFYRANLLSFFTPNGWSIALRKVPLHMAYGEEFNFLGLGVIVGLIIVILALAFQKRASKKISFFGYKAFTLCLIFFFFAVYYK